MPKSLAQGSLRPMMQTYIRDNASRIDVISLFRNMFTEPNPGNLYPFHFVVILLIVIFFADPAQQENLLGVFLSLLQSNAPFRLTLSGLEKYLHFALQPGYASQFSPNSEALVKALKDVLAQVILPNSHLYP